MLDISQLCLGSKSPLVKTNFRIFYSLFVVTNKTKTKLIKTQDLLGSNIKIIKLRNKKVSYPGHDLNSFIKLTDGCIRNSSHKHTTGLCWINSST